MRPSKEVSVGLIQTLMSKPPRVPDMIDAALRDLDISLEAVSQQYGFRLMLINIRDARSYEELDRQIYSVLRSEVGEVENFLPKNYLNYVRTFLELRELERHCLSASPKGAEVPSRSPSPVVGVSKEDEPSDALLGPIACGSGIEGLLVEYLNNVRKALSEVDEDSTWAYEVIKSMVALRYYRYLRNVELLGLGTSDLGQFLSFLRLNPISEVALRRAIESLRRLDGAGLMKYTIYEAAEALGIAANHLSHREGLINLLTLYLVTKYYEFMILRYVFLPKSLRRW